MKACVLEAVNQLEYKEVPTPIAGNGEVLLHIKACGICSSDFSRVFKSGTYHFPTIPGHEFSGIIEAVGDGVSKDLIGRRAVVFPLLPCNECEQCKLGNYALCADYNYFGSRCDGGFAEYLATPLWNIRLFDDTIPYQVAALAEPAAVAWHAVAAADLKEGEYVCISGTGTIAIMCGIWARKKGVRVIFPVRNKAKEEFLHSFEGFETILVDDDIDTAIKNCCPNGVDVVLECVGSPESICNAVKWVKTRGRVVLVGNPSGDVHLPQKLYWRILRSELTLTGVWNSVYPGEWEQVLTEINDIKDTLARLITHTFPLSAGKRAFDQLVSGEEFLIKALYSNE